MANKLSLNVAKTKLETDVQHGQEVGFKDV